MAAYQHEDGEFLRRIGPEIRRSAVHRGMADIDEAVGWIDRVIHHVVTTALGRDDPRAERWAADTLRAMLALIQAPQWFQAWELETVRDEQGYPVLAEWVSLVREPRNFGPGHLIAWIWLLDRPRTEPLVDGFMRQVTPILVEAVANRHKVAGGNWDEGMTDWESFF